MKLEKILMFFLIVFLLLGIIVPLGLLIFIKEKTYAALIGDTLGGTTAPFINISAIMIVIITYLYQRRNDRKNYDKELIFETFGNIKSEFDKINFNITTTSKDVKTVKNYSGRKALEESIRNMNSGVPIEQMERRDYFMAIINVFQATNSLLDTIKFNSRLNDSEKTLFISQLSLFYRNNLFIGKSERGDEVCDYHKIKHEIPKKLYDLIHKIEDKII